MKSIFFIVIILLCATITGFAQTPVQIKQAHEQKANTKPMTMQINSVAKQDSTLIKKITDVNKTPTATLNTSAQQKNIATTQLTQKPPKTGFQPSPALNEPKIYLKSGAKGKSSNTILVITINDSRQLKAADYSEVGLTTPVEDDRYPKHTKYVPFVPEFGPNESESLSTELDASVPEAVELNGTIPYTVNRSAALLDFTNGGSISIVITPKTVYPLIGPDTWNINSFTVTLNFEGDPTSPHNITWNGFTLSPAATSRTLKFDKNFNPIQ